MEKEEIDDAERKVRNKNIYSKKWRKKKKKKKERRKNTAKCANLAIFEHKKIDHNESYE